ncbi:MAG: helix-turn-helix domain-containing protein [bacterium]
MVKQEEILTTKEVMEYLKVTRPTVFKLIKTGQLRAAKVGRDYRIYRSDVDDFLKKASNLKVTTR